MKRTSAKMSFLLFFSEMIILTGIAGRNKLLIKEKLNRKVGLFTCLHLVQGSRFMVQGFGGGFAAFFIGRCPKVVFKSPVTSHSYDTREGIVSHVWHEILRLSPHLFWLGLFSHRAFFSAQDDDTGAEGLSSGRYVACFGTGGVIYDTSSSLAKGRAKGAGWIHVAV